MGTAPLFDHLAGYVHAVVDGQVHMHGLGPWFLHVF